MGILFPIVLVFLLASGNLHAGPYGNSNYDHLLDVETESPLDFKKLKSLIEKGQVGTYADLLAKLSEKGGYPTPQLKYVDPEFFSNYVLMHHSQSSQQMEISPAEPRIVLHSNRLFMAAPLKLGEKGERSLEVMEFDPKTDKFLFHEVVFNEKEKKATFVENSPRCFRCHRGRPIWGAYQIWPGAIGGLRDYVSLLGKGKPFHTKTVPLKESGWLDSLKEHPSFKALTKYLKPPHVSISGRRDDHTVLELAETPNSALGARLSFLNFRSISREIRDQEAYSKYKFVIAAAFLNCNDIESYFPEPLRVQHRTLSAKTMAELIKQTRELNDADRLRRIKLFEEYNEVKMDPEEYHELQDGFGEISAEVIAKLRFVLEPVGMNVKEWSLSHSPAKNSFSYQFATGAESSDVGVMLLGKKTLLPLLEKEYPELEYMAEKGAVLDKKMSKPYCDKLLPLSLAALANHTIKTPPKATDDSTHVK